MNDDYSVNRVDGTSVSFKPPQPLPRASKKIWINFDKDDQSNDNVATIQPSQSLQINNNDNDSSTIITSKSQIRSERVAVSVDAERLMPSSVTASASSNSVAVYQNKSFNQNQKEISSSVINPIKQFSKYQSEMM